MPQSFARLHIHLVFSTKGRVPCLRDDIRGELHAYMASVLNNAGCLVTLINSVDDHIHLLFELARTATLANTVKTLKTTSSVWLKNHGGDWADFAWQAGYGAFSVSESNTDAVYHYIATQREHHARTSFQDEYRALLTKHGITFDERYTWD